MTITRNFKLCLNAGTGSAPYINVSQYDEGETWLFELYSETGERYIPTTGAIVGVKSDGHGIANTGTVDSEGRVVIAETQQMTASAGRAIYELSIDGLTHGTANFIVAVERKPTDDAVMSDSDLSLIQEAIDSAAEIEDLLDGQDVPTVITPIISDWLDENITNPSNPPIDTSLTVAGAAADAKKTGDEITDLKSDISPLYDSENYATGTGSGSGTTQTATFSTALQANKKYKIDVEIDPSKTTTGNVYLSSGGTLTKIGEIASGATEASFDVTPSSVCEAIRFNSTVNTETYSVTVKVQTPTYASKSEVGELQEQIVDLGYDANNIVTYTDSETVGITWTAGYVSKSGTVSSSQTYSYTNKIPVSQGDVISSTASSNMFRFLCAYDSNDTPVSDSGMSADFNTYTVPAGIASVVLSAYNTQLSNSVIKSTNVTEYVVPQKTIGSFSASGNMNDGDEKKVPLVNVSKNTVQTFSADITSFNKIQIGRKTDSDYGYLEIDNTNITIKVLNSEDVVIPHGLTVANNINVRIIQNTDGQADPTKLYRGYIELSSNGQMFKTTDMNQMPQNYWTRAYCSPFVKSVGSVLTNCSMSYIPCDIFKNIYMFGDSYFSFYTDRWSYYMANDGYDKNVLMNAFAGESSASAVVALRNILSLGVVPNYIVWCLGMNDGADSVDAPSAAWASGRDNFLGQCKKYGINPVFGTIPTVPNKSNEQKNAWIRNSGYPYIDFAKAVGAQADGTWYSGMLSNDNVHPTVAGGVALYGRVLTDFPQIAYSN